MTALWEEVNLDVEYYAWLALDEGPRCGAGRGAWPSRMRLKARQAAERVPAVVDVIWPGGGTSHVRPLGVMPGNEEVKVAMKRASPEWHDRKQSRAFACEGVDAALQHGNGASLTDGGP